MGTQRRIMAEEIALKGGSARLMRVNAILSVTRQIYSLKHTMPYVLSNRARLLGSRIRTRLYHPHHSSLTFLPPNQGLRCIT